MCLWLRRTTSTGGSTLCTSWLTVVGLSPDAAEAITVNGRSAAVAGNTFTVTIPEAANIVTRLEAK